MKQPIPWTQEEIIKATKGEVLSAGSNLFFSGVSIDSRTISAREIFVAIRGDVHDGHIFAEKAIKLGVKGLIINRQEAVKLPCKEWKKAGILCVAVGDTIKALGCLASYNRTRADVSVVAITGSNGKTTTRGMTAEVVSRRFETLSTTGNLNNEIGLPLTLLRLSHSHKWAVVELGMNHPGEIERLARISKPDIGIITNIGPAHLEGLNSLEGVMNAKGELIDGIKPDGTAILNADDEMVMNLARRTSKKVLLFGFSDNASIRACLVEVKRDATSFTLILPEETVAVDLPVSGGFMVKNALAAASVGYLAGLTASEIKAGLENSAPEKGRMNIFTLSNGITIIDDSYNANPGSMEAAIKTLSELKADNRGVLIAGDMLELGKHSTKMHEKIGALCAESGIARLYTTGQFAGNTADGAIGNGMSRNSIVTGSHDDILENITGWLGSGDWVLVKGSRAMGMEKIVFKLKDWAERQSAQLL
ncbi:MAG: UDP-N-acetylmuramoyl-tripeptide--D-alanyl-D-alanine ligase [Proteobacteria bacterium]|nr:UDP-N-acetylmuramoyl-tripeptide--D-alanyl-D-alanine ligase [Pseudomonadota bacterium]MBU1711913.1 UDP-N-acetylmuramoyl-tripeptide--D-alanyl-D-alanine ligase [Pseudomonadota bacterium]